MLARWLRTHAHPGEKIFSENQYTQLCLGFHLSSRSRSGGLPRENTPVWNLDGEVIRLTWSWEPGTRAWLVLAGHPHIARLRHWAEPFPTDAVASAEGDAIVCRLEPSLRDAAFARAPP